MYISHVAHTQVSSTLAQSYTSHQRFTSLPALDGEFLLEKDKKTPVNIHKYDIFFILLICA